MEPYPNVEGFSSFTGYSGQAIKPIALRCIGEVLTRMDVPMVGCGGMWTWQDCVEFILMGCSATELCTAPMFKGFAMVEGLVEGMSKYLADKNFSSLDDIRGVGLKRFMDHGDLQETTRSRPMWTRKNAVAAKSVIMPARTEPAMPLRCATVRRL